MADAPSDSTLALPSDPDETIIRYQEILGEMGEKDNGPRLEITAGGRVDIHYPIYMTRAGNYRSALDPDALADLIAVVAGAVVGFDQDAIRAQIAAAEAAATQRGELASSSDPEITVIELNLAGIQRKVSCIGLRAAAKRHPDIEQLQALAEADDALRQLLAADDVESVD